jgi:ribosome-binding ATPase YchF (GTP1/OBG family)
MLIGIVGRPNTGKSTFFKACTLANVLIANYPFATISPNHGVGYVKVDCIDKELGVQCQPREGFCIKGKRFVPVELMDVAGLVKGASEGKGLGNQFLDSLREADAFIHIVDASGKTNEEGKPAENYYPGKDIEMIENELDLWYSGILKKVWRTFSRQLESTHANFVLAVNKQFSGLKVNEEQIKEALIKTGLNPEKPASWTEEEIFSFASTLRKISKPMIIAANKSDLPDSEGNIKKMKKEFSYPIIPCSADSELALREASKEGIIDYIPGDSDFGIKKEINQKQKSALEFIKKNVLDAYGNTGVQEILNYAVFELLKYIAVFPAGSKLADSKGNILPDCYLMPPNSTTLDFAFRLHEDLGKGFIRAIDIRTKKPLGKEHKLKDRDGIEIIAR